MHSKILNILILGAALAAAPAARAAAAVTVTPAPGAVRASYDSVSLLQMSSFTGVGHQEENDFFVNAYESLTFRVQSALAGASNTTLASFTLNGNPASATGSSTSLNYRISISRSAAQNLGPGPHAVKAVVQFPDTTVTAEWTLSFHAPSYTQAHIRAQVIRVNMGSGTPDTLGYRVLAADSIDGTLFRHPRLSIAPVFAGDTLRPARISGSITAAKGATLDLFPLRIGYAGAREVFAFRSASAVDSNYNPGFTLRQAQAAILKNFGKTLLMGPVLPGSSGSPGGSSVVSVSAKTENGWKVVVDSAYGDCPAGCTNLDHTEYQITSVDQDHKVCQRYSPQNHPSIVNYTCKINGEVVALAPGLRGTPARGAKGVPVRADGRLLTDPSTRAPQLRVPLPAR